MRIDNKDNEPKAQASLLKFPEENSIFSKTHIVEIILSFPNVRMRTNAFREEAFAEPVFSLRKFYTEQMFVSVRMQVQNHVQMQLVKRHKR